MRGPLFASKLGAFSQRLLLTSGCSEAHPIAKGPQLSDFLPDLLDKLSQLKSRREAVRDSPSASPEPGDDKEFEIQSYHVLVNDGGQPPCLLEDLDQIYLDPSSFIELLKPWLGDPPPNNPDALGVFSSPLARWREFRWWQLNNRSDRTVTAEERFAEFLEEKRNNSTATGLEGMTTEPDFEENIRMLWQIERASGRVRTIREVKDGIFADYADAARRRLAEHGFDEAFELHEDRRQQDKRTTWIEYLEFEYWWLDMDTNWVEQRRPSHDAAWAKLVQSGVLAAGETEEDLLASWTSFPGQEKTARTVAVRLFLQKSKPFRNAQTSAVRQSRRVQWALSQLPKMVSEPRQSEAPRKRQRQEQGEEGLAEADEQRLALKKKKTVRGRKEGASIPRPRARKPKGQPNSKATTGLLSLSRPSWELEDGKRRSSRVKDAQARAEAALKPHGTLREVP